MKVLNSYQVGEAVIISRFENKSVVVTGAGAGMGKEITRSLLKEGAAVVAVDLNGDALNALQKEVVGQQSEKLVTQKRNKLRR